MKRSSSDGTNRFIDYRTVHAYYSSPDPGPSHVYHSSSSSSPQPGPSHRLSSSSINSSDFSLKCSRIKNKSTEIQFIEIKSAFEGNLKTFLNKNSNIYFIDICILLVLISSLILNILRNVILAYWSMKFNIIVECTYVKPVINEYQNRSFKTKKHSCISQFITTRYNN